MVAEPACERIWDVLRRHLDPFPQDPDKAFIQAAWPIILGRAPDRVERQDALRQLRTGQRIDVTAGLLSSSDFSGRYRTWLDSAWRIPRSELAGLDDLGTNAEFVEQCYACLLDRKAERAGRDAYIRLLDEGAERLQVVGALIRSDEFADSIRTLCPDIDRAFLEAAFWILLGREPDDVERGDGLRQLGAGQNRRNEFTARLVSSAEFRDRYETWMEFTLDRRTGGPVLEGLLGLGTDSEFIAICFSCLLGRPADEQGSGYYQGRLTFHGSRLRVVRELALSEEFETRFRPLHPIERIPTDIQLCELANPAKWSNPEWVKILRSFKGPVDKGSMHRKAYEYAQTIYGLERLGRLRPDTTVLSVGAGHESILYWLANHVSRVIATDRYDPSWSESRASEGDATVISDPERYAPFPYATDRLVFLPMDGRSLGIADSSCDVAYSLSSIEHFGGFEGARDAVREMARILKAGGLLVLATEWLLAGPQCAEVFRPDEIHALIEESGLRLLAPIDEHVWHRYEASPVDLLNNPYQTPHMVVKIGPSTFTSVIVFLEKEDRCHVGPRPGRESGPSDATSESSRETTRRM